MSGGGGSPSLDYGLFFDAAIRTQHVFNDPKPQAFLLKPCLSGRRVRHSLNNESVSIGCSERQCSQVSTECQNIKLLLSFTTDLSYPSDFNGDIELLNEQRNIP